MSTCLFKQNIIYIYVYIYMDNRLVNATKKSVQSYF